MRLRIFTFLALGMVSARGAESMTRWDGWPGPVTGELRMPATIGSEIALVTAGLAKLPDLVAVRVTALGRARFSFSHAGRRIAESDEIALDVSRSHRLVISLGSLLPPLRSEIYWTKPHLLHLASELLVMIDGTVVLARPAECRAPTNGRRRAERRIREAGRGR